MLDEGVVGVISPDEGDRQDPHEGTVAARPFVGRAGMLGRRPGFQGMDCLAGRVPDVEAAVAIGRVGAVPVPRQDPLGLVLRIEADRQQRVEEGQHQRSVVAPGPRRLPVGAGGAELDRVDLRGRPGLVGHAGRVAHEVTPDGSREPAGQLTRLDCLCRGQPLRIPHSMGATGTTCGAGSRAPRRIPT